MARVARTVGILRRGIFFGRRSPGWPHRRASATVIIITATASLGKDPASVSPENEHRAAHHSRHHQATAERALGSNHHRTWCEHARPRFAAAPPRFCPPRRATSFCCVVSPAGWHSFARVCDKVAVKKWTFDTFSTSAFREAGPSSAALLAIWYTRY